MRLFDTFHQLGFLGATPNTIKILELQPQNETAELRKRTHWAASSIPIQKLER